MRDDQAIISHIGALGLTGQRSYFDWCAKNGFSLSVNKGSAQFKKERERQTELRAREQLAKSNKSVSLRKALHMLKEGQIVADYPYKDIISGPRIDKRTDLDAMIFLEATSDLFDQKNKTPRYIKAVRSLLDYDLYWVRPLSEWVPKSHNPDRQLSSLIRHLFAKYPVPVFMENAWLDKGTGTHREWYIHMGSGQNIRTAQNLPFSLTKKSAHCFATAPDDYTIPEALDWGVILAEGGDRRLALTLRGSRFGGDLAFKANTVRFFLENQMVASEQVHAILDYVHYLKFQIGDNGKPDQPNFTFTGRTYDSLSKQVERWHRQLGKEKKGGSIQKWEHSKISNFEYTEGTEGRESYKRYIIRELTSTDDLVSEGRAMRHCVASYAYQCVNGRCSIWSLSLHDKTGDWRLLTIEVVRGQITQMRGPQNRPTTAKERSIVTRWASKEGIGFATYV